MRKIAWKEIQKLNGEELEQLFFDSRNLCWKTHGKKLNVYYPNKYFPTISITGSICSQNCLYCNKHYLKNMLEITKPEDLFAFALKLSKKGGKGFLLSGGYDKNLKLPIEPFLKTIKEIKEKINLKINLHSGLVDYQLALQLKEAEIDSVSFDVITDQVVLKEILLSQKTDADYLTTYSALLKAKLNVVPHICLGLYYGSIKGNLEAIQEIIKFKPKNIVFLGFIPTKGTPMENSPTIEPEILAKILLYTRFLVPEIEQSLGCMRVRLQKYETMAVDAGINRIAVPKKATLQYALEKYNLELEKFENCCAI